VIRPNSDRFFKDTDGRINYNGTIQIRQSDIFDLQRCLTYIRDQIDCSRHPIGMTVFFRTSCMGLQSNNSRMRAGHCFRNFCAAFNEWPVSPTDKTEAHADELDKTNDLQGRALPPIFIFA